MAPQDVQARIDAVRWYHEIEFPGGQRSKVTDDDGPFHRTLWDFTRDCLGRVDFAGKSVLDIGRTLEYLETVGVPVVGYGTDTVPAFYARSSGFPVDYRVNEPTEAAKAIHAKFRLNLDGSMIIGNPVPEPDALASEEIDGVIESAIEEMNAKGITGKDTTPFLLARIAERTKGRSLEANIALIINNARVAAEIAAAYSQLAGSDA